MLNEKSDAADLKAKIVETKSLLKRGMDAHQNMKQINKFYRKRGTCKGFPGMTDEKALELDAIAGNKANSPFSSREMEKSNYDIGCLKNRLMELQDQLVDEDESQ